MEDVNLPFHDYGIFTYGRRAHIKLNLLLYTRLSHHLRLLPNDQNLTEQYIQYRR